MRHLPIFRVILSGGFYAASTDLPCHSERSIEDVESKNPLLFDSTVMKSDYGPKWSSAPTAWDALWWIS